MEIVAGASRRSYSLDGEAVLKIAVPLPKYHYNAGRALLDCGTGMQGEWIPPVALGYSYSRRIGRVRHVGPPSALRQMSFPR